MPHVTEPSEHQLSVPLPKRLSTSLPKAPPIWAISSASPSVSTPLPAKCARHQDGRRGICCKELKVEERHLIDPDIMRDVVIGLSDGLTVPFALTAGLASLGNSKVVVLGGMAELIAGAISMGIGAFLATQAERDQYKFLHTQTASRVQRSCAGELEREVDEILGPLGVPTELSRQVADALRKEELLLRENSNFHYPRPQDEESTRSSSPDLIHTPSSDHHHLRWSQSIGLTSFLLKFGQGLSPIPKSRMYLSALTIGLGYLIGGLIPLIPYFFVDPVGKALVYSSILTGIILLIFGAVKAHITGAAGGDESAVVDEKSKRRYGGYFYGAISTLAVGGAAAFCAYEIVKLLESKE